MNYATSEALKPLALICAVFTVTANAATQYTITDPGTSGGTESFAYGISDAGHVVGEADVANNTRAWTAASRPAPSMLPGTFSPDNRPPPATV